MNPIDFPKILAFGSVPLCKPASRKITLRNNNAFVVPYEIEILEPHPYFKIDPCIGKIDANGIVAIKITYSPITFGSSTTVLRLSLNSPGITPKDCVVSARAVSGLLEKEELLKSQQNVMRKLDTMTMRTNNILQNSTGFGTTVVSARTGSPAVNENSQVVHAGDHNPRDPVAVVLASTFRGQNTYEVLHHSISDQKNKSRMLTMENIGASDPIDNILIGSKVIDPVSGLRTLKAKAQCKPRGPGSGNAFDAGAEWMANQFKEKHLRRLKRKEGNM